MMDALETNMKFFTCIWKIKNFSFCCYVKDWTINSPSFLENERKVNLLSLKLRIHEKFIVCACAAKSPFSFLANCELAFLTPDGSMLHYVEVRNVDFKNLKDRVLLAIDLKTIFGEDAFPPNDILTVQCKIWAAAESGLEAGQITAETEIEVQRLSSVWTIENCSKLTEGGAVTKNIRCKSELEPFFSFAFYIKGGIPFIERKPLHTKSVKFCKIGFFLVDANGKRIRCGRHHFVANQRDIDSLSFMMEDLFRNGSLYLPNDTLTLQYEIEFSTGRKVQKTLDWDSFLDAKEEIQTLSTDNITTSGEKYADSLLSWKDDLLYILNNGFLFDTCLKTTSNSFAVHSLILRIRSPVFTDMLTACEGLKEGIYIGKMESDTVRKFILFLYTDTLYDLDWRSAKSLYIASHEYEITYLKGVCISFLKSNLDCNNCCEILYIASKHQDYDLVSAVQDYLSRHADEILVSDAWRNLEENHPSLTSKTLRKLYLENCGNKI